MNTHHVTTQASVGSNTDPSGPPPTNILNRYYNPIKLGSILAILIGLFLLVPTLPIAAGIEWLQEWIAGLGVWGLLVFGVVYVVGAVLFVPGLALTILAGVLFGLVWGMVTVSLASTTAAALAFLIGRYIARDAVREQTRNYPTFNAVDLAIAESGWKIVFMLRLVPLFPFSIGNYLLGLTPVRFWGYVLASWIGMLPGTFVYVYLGNLGRITVEAAATGAERTLDPAEWILMIGGGVMALVVIYYITRLVRRKLAEQTAVDAAGQSPADEESRPAASRPAPGWKPVVFIAAALVFLAGGIGGWLNPNWFDRAVVAMFGPPQRVMIEAYEEKPDGPTFDHGPFDEILRQYVNNNGGVDYEGLLEDPEPLLEYNRSLADAPFDEMGRSEKLALLINAYNSFTLELILKHYDLVKDHREGIKAIPTNQRWQAQRWDIGGNIWSLDNIEHDQIRPYFIEPDIHWVVVCAAVGCPPLRPEAYSGDPERLREQLNDQARIIHTDGSRWFQYDRENGVLGLTPLYNWYRGDYEQVAGNILDYAAKYNRQLAEDLEAGNRPAVRWLEYSWRLNDQENLPEKYQ